MATRDVTDTPTAFPGLSSGADYYAQNQGVVVVRMKIAADATPPTQRTDDGRTFDAGAGDFFELSAGESLYVWTVDEGASGIVYVGDAA